MKTISAIIAIAFAASTVSAAISPEVQLCIDDLAAVESQLGVVTTGVTNWTVESGYLGALAVQADEQVLEQKLDTAGTDCCVSLTPTEEETLAVLSQVSTLVPAVEASLDIIVTRKPDFDSVPLVTNLVTTDLTNLKTKTDKVDNCLLNATPANHKAEAQAYVDTINSAFADAFAAYGL